MSKSIRSERHGALRAIIKDRRKEADLTQAEVAKRLGRYQSYIAMIEGDELQVGLLEFLDLANAIGFDPAAAIRKLAKIDET